MTGARSADLAALHDLAAERAVLGAVLLSPDVLHEAAAAGLVAVSFHLEPHRQVWRAMCATARAGSLDLVSLTGALETARALEQVGGYSYIAGLSAAVPSIVGIRTHIDTVLRKARARALLVDCADATGRITQGDDPDDVRASLASRLVAGTAEPVLRDRWRTVGDWSKDDAGDWLSAAPPARRYILSAEKDRRGSGEWIGMLPLGKVAMLAGAGGCGKTMALCQLAVAVAAGNQLAAGAGPRWLDTFRVDAPGRVALMTGEEDAPELRRRLWQTVGLMGLDDGARERVRRNLVAVPLTGADVALLSSTPDGRTEATAVAEALRRHLSGGEWSLVILDPMSRFEPPGAEADNVTATRFITACERLTEAPGGPAVLLSHHTSQVARKEGEGGATAARGVTGLTDAVRAVFLLRPVVVGKWPVGNLVELTMDKSNYGMFPPPLLLARDREHGGGLRPAEAGRGDFKEHERMEAAAKAAKVEATATKTEATAVGRATGKQRAAATATGPKPGW